MNTQPKSFRTRKFLLGGAAAITLLAGAASFTNAFARPPHHEGWSMEQGVPVDRIEHRADRMLKQVNATADQQA